MVTRICLLIVTLVAAGPAAGRNAPAAGPVGDPFGVRMPSERGIGSFDPAAPALRFATRGLARLYATLRLETRPVQTTRRIRSFIERRYAPVPDRFPAAIRVLTDSTQTIVHIGVLLFEERPHALDLQVVCFIERVLLDYTTRAGSSGDMLAADRLEIVHRGLAYTDPSRDELMAVIQDIRRGRTFHLSEYQYRFRFTADTDDARQAVIIHFPAEAALILGQTKPEMDSLLIRRLTALRQAPPGPPPAVSADTLLPYGSVFRQPGDSLHPGLTADRFFEWKQGTLLPLRAPSLRRESIASRLQTPLPGDRERLRITHRTYETPYPSYVVPLAAFVRYMQRDHRVFTGFESSHDDTLRVAVIFRHTRYDYVHLLQIAWPIEAPGGNPPPLESTLYSYVRWDNVRRLFAEP